MQQRLIVALIAVALCPLISAQSQTRTFNPGRPSQSARFVGGGKPPVSFFTETSDNNFFGTGAGAHVTTGFYNSFFGGNSGYYTAGGAGNCLFGFDSGFSNAEGSHNSMFGFQAGFFSQASENCFFGANSGYETLTGDFNSFFGADSGSNNETGFNNTFVGYAAGFDNSTGFGGAFFGAHAGEHNTVEQHNTFIGAYTDLDPGLSPANNPVRDSTAVGYRAFITQSNTVILGAIDGVNGATASVNVGIGTTTPARQLHLKGPNAVFRMDRSTDTASFILVRTDPAGLNQWKSFVVGTNATGVNNGEFIINDIGAAVGGGGARRMTITNEGNALFTGVVSAPSFVQTSSLAFKTNVRTIENALDVVERLRGVRFDWKDSGEAAVGLIAEEVEQVLPEVVAREDGAASGVSYANLVAVLVEAVKEQERKNDDQREAYLAELVSLKARLTKLEALLAEK